MGEGYFVGWGCTPNQFLEQPCADRIQRRYVTEIDDINGRNVDLAAEPFQRLDIRDRPDAMRVQDTAIVLRQFESG